MRRKRGFLAASALVAAFAGCGGDDEPETTGAAPDPAPALTAAAHDAAPDGPIEQGELSEDDRAAVESAVRAYVAGLSGGDAAAVCGLLEPRALDPTEPPVQRGGCEQSLAASLGTNPEGGGPAW